MDRDLNRRGLLKATGSFGLLNVAQGLVTAKGGKYPTVDDLGPYENAPIETFAAGSHKDPQHDRFAIVTAAFGDGIQLYVADGADEVTDHPDKVYQITDDAVCGAFEPQWSGGNRLEFVLDYTRYRLKLPPSYEVMPRDIVTEDVTERERSRGPRNRNQNARNRGRGPRDRNRSPRDRTRGSRGDAE